MAELRCSLCARPQGQEHSKRCSSDQFSEHYCEFPDEIKAERDRYREALARIADANSGHWGWIAHKALNLTATAPEDGSTL